MCSRVPTLQTFNKWVQLDKSQPMIGMEVGCFFGGTSVGLVNWMKHPESKLICVDPFLDTYLPEKSLYEHYWSAPRWKGQRARFVQTTQHVKSRLIVHQGFSQDILPTLESQWKNKLAFVFIDGDHRAEAVYKDSVGSFNLLQIGGYLVFDDYFWGLELPEEFHTQKGIDRFLAEYQGQYELINKDHKDRQVVVRKIDSTKL